QYRDRDRDGQLLAQATRTYYLYSDHSLLAEATQPITLHPDGSVSAQGEPTLTAQYGPHPQQPFTTRTLFIKTRNSNGQDTVGYYQQTTWVRRSRPSTKPAVSFGRRITTPSGKRR
ncbi:hypothetical protein, partial [Chitiniphilus shinanonensis]|uniref:hypothetical protein n=1 Tax=Chitiniphilus shinanonensis TaxID=553088 RepID=UPI003340E676